MILTEFKMGHREHSQRGAVTVFVSMLLLLMITVLVLTAYTISTTNLRAVGNVQVRKEATAAANFIIENRLATDFWLLTSVVTSPVDLNLDLVPEYTVVLQPPECVRATQASGATSSSVTLPGMSGNTFWHTTWEFEATATEAASGAEVQVVQGFRVLVSQEVRDDYCG